MTQPTSASAASGFSLETSTYRGSTAYLMASGAAEPFMQPWYEPISCTPKDTGMPMGGIGSAFTLTPAGTTPVLSGIGGLHITAKPGETLALHSFFFAEREAAAQLQVLDAAGVLRRNRFVPLVDSQGKPWLTGDETAEEAAAAVSRMEADPGLYFHNAAALERWHVELSPKTRQALAHGPSESLSQALLLDVFGKSLAKPCRFQTSLTGDAGLADGREGVAGQKPYPSEAMDYQGLYPLASTRFQADGHGLRLSELAYTPVIAGDEKWCSLPVSGTSFTLENPTSKALEATVVFALENMVGDDVIKARPGVQDAWFHLVKTARFQTGQRVEMDLGGDRKALGFTLGQEPGKAGGDLRGEVSVLVEIPALNEGDGFWATLAPNAYASQTEGLIAEALQTGRLPAGGESPLVTGRERRMAALCVTVLLPPGSQKSVHIALALDFPDIALRGFASQKKYTRFYPPTGESVSRSAKLAADLLRNREDLLARIRNDHAALPHLGKLPGLLATGESAAGLRLLTQLANNLGFIADATVWDVEDRFWMRECADYPFFNSLDVYFYGSFALLHLLPRLDGCVLKEFAASILAEDSRTRRHWEYMHEPFADLPEARLEGPRGVPGAVPHDMGSPFDPAPDAYIWHNVKLWKDLAPKYLLMVWRHFKVTGNRDILAACWPAAKAALDYLDAMRLPGEALPMTGGTDDTFDNLESRGISIYCGSLWIAALAAGEALAEELGQGEIAAYWRGLQAAARPAVTQTLWDEKDGYYHFWNDPRDGSRSDDVFADQLLADLWLRLLGLPELTPDDKARRAAKTVFAKNFQARNRWIGPANLVAKDGSTLEAFQAQDVWLGIQFSLAAVSADLGLDSESWELLEVSYHNLYEMARIPFGAPEGFNGSVVLTAPILAARLGLDAATARDVLQKLRALGLLSPDFRCDAKSRMGLNDFALAYRSSARTDAGEGAEKDPGFIAALHHFVQTHALQYTAGRYLRPGMLWSLLGLVGKPA